MGGRRMGVRVMPGRLAFALGRVVLMLGLLFMNLWTNERAAAAPVDPTAPGELAIARGNVGVGLYESQHWADALRAFEEADTLYHSPVFVLYEARCLSNLGRLIEARAHYRAVEADPLPEEAPKVWVDAKSDAARERVVAERDIGAIRVVVRGPARGDVRLDGDLVDVDEPIEVDPGEHALRVAWSSGALHKTIVVHRGERDAIVVFDTTPTTAPGPVLGSSHGARIAGIIVASVGGALLVAGGVTGAFALDEAASAKGALPVTCTAALACPADTLPAIDRAFAPAETLAHVTDGLLVGGGIAAAVGVVLAIADPGGKHAHATPSGLAVRFP